jgi:hypothetical protein
MTNRIKPGPGMGPSWKELIESGELVRILDAQVERESGPTVLNKGSLFAPTPDGAKLVGRTTRWGNPFTLDDPDDDDERALIIRMHREWVLSSDEPKTVTSKSGRTKTYDPLWVRAHVSELRGVDLVCPGNCKPRPCHADVLLELANGGATSWSL